MDPNSPENAKNPSLTNTNILTPDPSTSPASPSSPQNTTPLPPTVISMNTSDNNSNKKILAGSVALVLALAIIALIVIQVYQPNLLQTLVSQFKLDLAQNPSASPVSSSTPAASAGTPPQADPIVVKAFANAKKVMNRVDLNSHALYKSSLNYVYRAKIISIKKGADGLLEITTDRSISNLPSTWKFNKLTKTFILGKDDVMGKSDPLQIKEGSNIQINASYIITAKNDTEIPDTFNLDSVILLADSRKLSMAKNSVPSAIPATIIDKEETLFPITDPITKKAFDNSKKIMDQIDLYAKEVDSGLLYVYEGKLTEVNKLENGLTQITTDTKVAGIPNTWELDKNSLIFQFSKQDRIDSSNLRVGSNVRIATIFIIQTNWEEVYIHNQFVLSSISLLD